MSKLTDDAWLAPHFSNIRARSQRAKEQAQHLTHGKSLWEWAMGHDWFGLHRLADGSWVYRDWAPNAQKLQLVGDFSHWQEKDDYAAESRPHGEWELHLPADALSHGQHYRVRINGRDRLPAWGRRMVQDQTTFAFSAQVWEPAAKYVWKNAAPPPAAFPRIYEAHVGMATEEARVGTWIEFRENRLPAIVKAGYNTVQLMGVMEHPYYGSFGYHVGSFFASSSRFGTPEELMELVDAAHGLGLHVVMDLVHSHAVKNDVESIACYDGTFYQFFHNGPRGYHEAWDSRCFDYAKPNVQHFLLSNLRYWLEEFRFDGFRFDGVTSMLYQDHGLGGRFNSYDDYFSSNVDEDAVTYLTMANTLIHQAPQPAFSIAEDVSGMPGLASPVDQDGMGFDFRLAMGLPDHWFKLVKETRDEDWSMNALWRELTNHRAEEKAISYVESHDQAMVGGKSFIFEMIDAAMYDSMHCGSQNVQVDRGIALHKLARLMTYVTAGSGYMTFMGNEFGHPEWIDFPREGNGWCYAKALRQWSLRDNASLRFKDLGDFDAALQQLPCEGSLPQLNKADDGDKVLAVQRGNLFVAANFHPSKSYVDYGFRVPPGKYRLKLSTEGDHPRDHVLKTVTDTSGQAWLCLYLPSRTGLVWEYDHE